MKLRMIFILLACIPGISRSQDKDDNRIYWLTNRTALVQLSVYLDACPGLGLIKEDYDDGFLQSVINRTHYLLDASDSIAAETKLTYTAEAFFRDVVFGKPPDISFDGVRYSPACIDVVGRINESIKEGSFDRLLDNIDYKSNEYTGLKATLSLLNDSLNTILKDANQLQPPKRLIGNLRSKINGVVRALNTVRWLDCLIKRNDYTIIVNIPSATLLLYKNREIIFETKVIVGKRSTRTPLFISRLTDVTIYPYWYVPKSIATKELLPMIKKDIRYIDNNNFQLLDKDGRIIDPYSINWQHLNAQNFPYTIRQSTGCDNSLGLIKLNVNHPNNVYLHDTPWKILFESANRFYSHGCIRVENAKGLAHILLEENSIAVDTLDEQANPVKHGPRVLPIDNTISVVVLYNTAWFDSSGIIRFYSDIYSRLPKS